MQVNCFAAPGDALEELERAWRISDELFRLVNGAWSAKPIPLRHPFVFYLGHLPAFAWNQIGRGVLGAPPIDATFEDLFERGIDPSPKEIGSEDGRNPWPNIDAVLEYKRLVRDEVRRVYAEVDACEREPLCQHNRVVQLVLEHELMHHETLSYMIKELDHARKRRPDSIPPPVRSAHVPEEEMVAISGGSATLGADFEEVQFGWDNEFPSCERRVENFYLGRLPVTIGEYFRFVKAGGYDDPALWSVEGLSWIRRANRRHPQGWFRRDRTWMVRTFFEDVPLEEVLGWPVLVTQIEAESYARWVDARLPTEAELHRAAYGTPAGPQRPFPWGDDEPRPEHGNFGLRCLDPIPVGLAPAGASAFGIEELVGNGWEWTSTPFGPLPGFEPWMDTYPGYSADFFGGEHYVVFGGAWATHPRLLRKSFRNWFQRWYPYAAATFRCVRT